MLSQRQRKKSKIATAASVQLFERRKSGEYSTEYSIAVLKWRIISQLHSENARLLMDGKSNMTKEKDIIEKNMLECYRNHSACIILQSQKMVE